MEITSVADISIQKFGILVFDPLAFIIVVFSFIIGFYIVISL